MDNTDKAFFATILALFAMFLGHPVLAFLIFFLGVV